MENEKSRYGDAADATWKMELLILLRRLTGAQGTWKDDVGCPPFMGDFCKVTFKCTGLHKFALLTKVKCMVAYGGMLPLSIYFT